ncbi:MAG TPA: hypothetical protein VI039_12945 [Solirubrobacterales bacterium]
MEKPTAPVPGDEPSDSADEGKSPKDSLPDFEEADDGVVDRHMEADDLPRKVGLLVAEGRDFGPHQANPFALAGLIKHYAATVYAIAIRGMQPGEWPAPPGVAALEIASAHVEFVSAEDEALRLDGFDASPAVLAAQRVGDLMEAEGDELVELARSVGPRATRAYRQLLKAIGESDKATVSWAAADREPATVSSTQAARAFRALDREGESESDEFTVLGHLSMADADVNRFKLKLFKGAPRPPQLKRKRVVHGTYEDPVGVLLTEHGLWNKDVEAEIHVERERAETVATPRDPTFVLVSVREAAAPVGKGRSPMPGSISLDLGE